jgi:hypothetical protein
MVGEFLLDRSFHSIYAIRSLSRGSQHWRVTPDDNYALFHLDHRDRAVAG